MLHAAYRVPELAASIAFYERAFGMKVLHSSASSGRADAVLGYGGPATNFVVQLTSEEGASFAIGTGFGHFGLAVADVAATVEAVKAAGGTFLVSMEENVGDTTATIAFVEDNAGYWWELIERARTPIVEPIAQVMLRVTDMERAIAFYRDCLGMTLIRTRDNEEHKVRGLWKRAPFVGEGGRGKGGDPQPTHDIPPLIFFHHHVPSSRWRSWATDPNKTEPCLS